MTESYVGAWRLTRSITDAAARPIDCSGSATLRRKADHLRYDERVTLRLDGKFVRATRTYRLTTRSGILCAAFENGSPFFELTLDAHGHGTAVHPCGDDRYVLRLTLREPDRWTTRWDVSGTKDQQIITHYTRIPPVDSAASLEPCAEELSAS